MDESGAEWAASYSRADGIRSFFAPIANLATGAIVGMEIESRPRDAAMREIVAAAAGSSGRRAALDAGAAAAGIRRAAELGCVVPLHVNLLADTIAEGPGGALAEVHRAVGDAGRSPAEIVVEIGAPAGEPTDDAVLAGARALRDRGYRLAVDEVGLGDHPLALIARLNPDLVVLHPEIVAGLDADPGGQAVTDAVVRLCRRIGAEVVAGGIDTVADLEAVRRHGVRIGQGPLLATPSRRPVARLAEPLPVGEPLVRPPAAVAATAPTTLGEFVRPAVMVGEDATGQEVRDLFRASPELSGVVLTTEAQQPVAMLERNRFLLAVSARFGFALHAERPVRDLADPPRVLPLDSDPRDALRLLGDGHGAVHDEVAVVDGYGRCRGVVRIADLLQALAGMEHQRALALHPVTGLPGLPSLTEALEQRIAAGQGVGIGLITADLFAPTLAGGFDAVLDGLRRISRAVTDTLPRFPGSTVAHGTGDDLVVLTGLDAPPAFDAAVRAALTTRRAPAVATAWLRHVQGEAAGAAEIARALGRLRARLHSAGPVASVTPRPVAG